jgi:hypothetical protein
MLVRVFYLKWDCMPWLTVPTDRNTTWCHPDADTSPNATIEAPENFARTQSKHSLRHGRSHNSTGHSFRHPLNRNKPSTGTTSIGSDLGSMYDSIQYADGSVETRGKGETEKELENREDLISASGSGMQKKRERLPNDSGVDMNMDIGEREDDEGYKTEKKRGVFGKLGL